MKPDPDNLQNIYQGPIYPPKNIIYNYVSNTVRQTDRQANKSRQTQSWRSYRQLYKNSKYLCMIVCMMAQNQ